MKWLYAIIVLIVLILGIAMYYSYSNDNTGYFSLFGIGTKTKVTNTNYDNNLKLDTNNIRVDTNVRIDNNIRVDTNMIVDGNLLIRKDCDVNRDYILYAQPYNSYDGLIELNTKLIQIVMDYNQIHILNRNDSNMLRTQLLKDELDRLQYWTDSLSTIYTNSYLWQNCIAPYYVRE